MSVNGYKRTVIILSCLVVVLLGCLWDLGWKLFNRRTEARTVWNVIVDYENTRNRFRKMTVADDIAYLEIYARANGGALASDGTISRIAELEKKRILKDLIADLRKKTGDDFGDDPNTWLEKYGATH